jgi:hypothetical protein
VSCDEIADAVATGIGQRAHVPIVLPVSEIENT